MSVFNAAVASSLSFSVPGIMRFDWLRRSQVSNMNRVATVDSEFFKRSKVRSAPVVILSIGAATDAEDPSATVFSTSRQSPVI